MTSKSVMKRIEIQKKSKKKLIKVALTARMDFEILADNYVDAFNEAIQSIEITHEGYKGASYH